MDETVQFIKECLGFDTKLRLLCDESYIRYMASCVKDPGDLQFSHVVEKNFHADVMRMFDVEYIDVDSTWCVLELLVNHLGSGLRSGEIEEYAHVVQCALMSCCFSCGHHGESVDRVTCLKSVLQFASHTPYIFASMKEELCLLVQDIFGLPVLSINNNGKMFIFPLTPTQRKKLEDFKDDRLEAAEQMSDEAKEFFKKKDGESSEKRKNNKKQRKKTKKQQDETAQFIKECMGFDSKLCLLCDASYIRFMASCVKHPIDLVGNEYVYADVMRMFDVESIDVDSTWCVLKLLSDKLKTVDHSEEDAHVLKCAMKSRCFVCSHHGKAVDELTCIKTVLHPRHLHCYIFASLNEKLCLLVQNIFGLPVLSADNNRKKILLPLTPPLRAKLEILKKNRLAKLTQDMAAKQVNDVKADEEKTLLNKKKEVSFKKKEDGGEAPVKRKKLRNRKTSKTSRCEEDEFQAKKIVTGTLFYFFSVFYHVDET